MKKQKTPTTQTKKEGLITVAFRAPAAMVEKIDGIASEQRRNRSNAILFLMEQALEIAATK
jgi:hypothetical protein